MRSRHGHKIILQSSLWEKGPILSFLKTKDKQSLAQQFACLTIFSVFKITGYHFEHFHLHYNREKIIRVVNWNAKIMQVHLNAIACRDIKLIHF